MSSAGFLTPEELTLLTALAKSGKLEHRVARRANAMVLLDRGFSFTTVAEVLLVDDSTVRDWQAEFRSTGIEGLQTFNHKAINDQEHIEYLPVMDYRNNSILLDKITSVDVNKTIQRSLTKAIARHGLGLYVYAGEDLPGGETKVASKKPVAKKPVAKKMTTIELNVGDENWDKVLKYVVANKSKGLKVIGEELKTKYNMTTAVKKEIANAI